MAALKKAGVFSLILCQVLVERYVEGKRLLFLAVYRWKILFDCNWKQAC